jgi:hypothetical protein
VPETIVYIMVAGTTVLQILRFAYLLCNQYIRIASEICTSSHVCMMFVAMSTAAMQHGGSQAAEVEKVGCRRRFYLKQVELPQNRYFLFMRELIAVELTPSLYSIAR